MAGMDALQVEVQLQQRPAQKYQCRNHKEKEGKFLDGRCPSGCNKTIQMR